MSDLKKILEEIEQEFDRRINIKLKIMCGLGDDTYRYRYGKSLEDYQQGKLLVTDIIRKHMSGKDTNFSTNDGWIPVEERMPEEKANPVSQDFYEYQVTARFGEVTDVRHYKFGNGHWWNGPGIVDKYVIAWRERPYPYHPERRIQNGNQ